MKPIIEIKEISKKFQLTHNEQPYLSLRDSIQSVFKKNINAKEDFYALKNVSFDLFQGETIGIIGKNGAGKSTLLKILSKITPPTSGKIIARGMIASLLEVGTGFHPELTGRENVYLNGSILGMKKKDILRNFDAIVDFSGVEKFIDMPLKHYSSGMQLRLAFAVAAFLENEILIIDEVLAVGDAEFQRKCIGKMEDISKSGRTIMFVSHNFNQISNICKRSVYLKNGSVFMDGDTANVIAEYNKASHHKQDSLFNIVSSVVDSENWGNNSTLMVNISWESGLLEAGWEIDLACYTGDRVKVFAVQSQYVHGFSSSDPELNYINFFIKNTNFAERTYFFDIGVRKGRNETYSTIIENCLQVATTGLDLPEFKRSDVIVVPEVSVKVGKNYE